jgi:hypothetical protein
VIYVKKNTFIADNTTTFKIYAFEKYMWLTSGGRIFDIRLHHFGNKNCICGDDSEDNQSKTVVAIFIAENW